MAEYEAAGSNNNNNKKKGRKKPAKKKEKKLEKPHPDTSESFPQAFCLPGILPECQDQGKSHHFIKANCFPKASLASARSIWGRTLQPQPTMKVPRWWHEFLWISSTARVIAGSLLSFPAPLWWQVAYCQINPAAATLLLDWQESPSTQENLVPRICFLAVYVCSRHWARSPRWCFTSSCTRKVHSWHTERHL